MIIQPTPQQSSTLAQKLVQQPADKRKRHEIDNAKAEQPKPPPTSSKLSVYA